MNELKQACEAFEKLIQEQLDRIANMNCEKTDFATKKTVTIGVLDGDGIGPIITSQATRVLKHLLADEVEKGTIVIKEINGLTIENRMAQGKAVPDDVLAEIKTCDVLLKGPTTTPHGGTMESANVALRRELDLYANVRPVSIPEKNIDWMFYRENTEGEYVLSLVMRRSPVRVRSLAPRKRAIQPDCSFSYSPDSKDQIQQPGGLLIAG